jgi:hypothetical protein
VSSYVILSVAKDPCAPRRTERLLSERGPSLRSG